MDDSYPLVLDVGSGRTKAGFGGDKFPRATYSSVLSHPKHMPVMVGMDYRDTFVGDEAESKAFNSTVIEPIERGIITNYQAYESLLHHVFYNELRVTPGIFRCFFASYGLEEHLVLMIDCLLSPSFQRKKLTEMLFETFNVTATLIHSDSVLPLYVQKKQSGIVLHVGHGVSSVVAVHEGEIIPKSMYRLNLGGKDCTNHFVEMIKSKNKKAYVPYSSYWRNVNRVKEKIPSSDEGKQSYKFEIGQNFRVGTGFDIDKFEFRDQVTSVLFDEILSGLADAKKDKNLPCTIPQLLKKCVESIDSDLHRSVLSHISIAGGGSCISGFEKKLTSAIEDGDCGFRPQMVDWNLVFGKERAFHDWVGGSMAVASKAFRKDRCINSDQYGEMGADRAAKHFSC